MEPLHPNERLEQSLKTLAILLVVLVIIQGLFGHWDAILSASEEWLLYGVKGIWGE